MFTTTEKSDKEIKEDVLAELEYEPSVKITDIGVLVKNGTVTLNGFATSYGEKYDAVKTAKRVGGVRAIADDIEVKFPEPFKRNDGEIAAAAANNVEALCWHLSDNPVQITVSDGWITLEGQVEWWYQKDAAENTVRYLLGVKGVSNLITIRSKVTAIKVESAIRASFERSALLEAKKIEVKMSGNNVNLTGKVRNYTEREEAERVAWAAPGVSSVNNELTVE